MIIIPDIHGRTFWKDAVKEHENEDIIFLGDYLDPYPQEEVSAEGAFENFKEIIEFKKAHPNNVTLLVGNHDQHYFIENSGISSRFSHAHHRQYYKLYTENSNQFQLCFECNIEGKRFVFSHAGITRGWKDERFPDVPDDKICDFINNAYLTEDPKIGPYLSDVSFERWGDREFGSMTWADITEHFKEKENHVADYQIFGHTQLNAQPIIADNFACLDVRRAFNINEHGEILEMDGTPAIKYDDLIKKLKDGQRDNS